MMECALRLKRIFFDCYRFCNLFRGRETGETFGIM